MTQVIWKYELNPYPGDQLINIDKKAAILSVGVQNKTIQLWAKVDPGAVLDQHIFRIIGTGHQMLEEDYPGRYIGTVILEPFVWHVYDRGAPSLTPGEIDKGEMGL